MLKKELTTAILVAFLSLGLVATAMAGEVVYNGSEAGSDEFSFDAQNGNIDVVKNHVYDEEALAKVGTEAGNWEYRYDAPETKADITARNYNYDQESLASIGTEAGNDGFSFDATETRSYGSAPNEAVADESKVRDAVCKGC